jgi:hypothetical protein
MKMKKELVNGKPDVIQKQLIQLVRWNNKITNDDGSVEFKINISINLRHQDEDKKWKDKGTVTFPLKDLVSLEEAIAEYRKQYSNG